MSGFTTPDGPRFTIFGEGGGQQLADELDVPLLGKVPLNEDLREHADGGSPLVLTDPNPGRRDRDPRSGARDRRRDPAGAAGDAGAGRGGTPAAGPRSAAPSCRSSRPAASDGSGATFA